MTTSGAYTVFSGTVTRDAIIQQAMKNIGKLDPYDTMDPVDVQTCAFQLNMICKQRMGKSDGSPGLKVWTRRRGHLFLSGTAGRYSVGPTANGWTENYVSTTTTATAALGAGSLALTSVAGMTIGDKIGIQVGSDGGTIQWTTISNIVSLTVSLGAVTSDVVNLGAQIITYTTTAQQPLKIEAAVLRDSELNDVPVNILQQADYDFLPQKANPQNESDPTAVYYEFQLGNSYLYTDCGASSDVTKHLVLTYLEPVQDLNSPLDNLEYPAECYLALTWLLSEQIAPMMFKVFTPAMRVLKDEAVAIAFHKDAEVNTMYFQSGQD